MKFAFPLGIFNKNYGNWFFLTNSHISSWDNQSLLNCHSTLFLFYHFFYLFPPSEQVNNYSMVSFIPLDLRKEKRYASLFLFLAYPSYGSFLE